MQTNLSGPALTSGLASLFDDRGPSRTQSPSFTFLRSGLAGRCILRVLLLAPPLVEGTVAPALAFRGNGCSRGTFNLSAMAGGGASEARGTSGRTGSLKFLRIQRGGNRWSCSRRLSWEKVSIISVCFQRKRLVSRLLREELAGPDVGTTQRLDAVQQFSVGL